MAPHLAHTRTALVLGTMLIVALATLLAIEPASAAVAPSLIKVFYGATGVDSVKIFATGDLNVLSHLRRIFKYDAAGTLTRVFRNNKNYCAFSPNGEVFCFDKSANPVKILRLSPSGQLLNSFDAQPGQQTASPASITVDHTGTLYAAVRVRPETWISRYHPNGTVAQSFASIPSTLTIFDMHVDSQRNVYWVGRNDANNSKFTLFKSFSDGRLDTDFNSLEIQAYASCAALDPTNDYLFRRTREGTTIDRVSPANGSVLASTPLPSPYTNALFTLGLNADFLVFTNDQVATLSPSGVATTLLDMSSMVDLRYSTSIGVDSSNRVIILAGGPDAFTTATVFTTAAGLTDTQTSSVSTGFVYNPTAPLALDSLNRSYVVSRNASNMLQLVVCTDVAVLARFDLWPEYDSSRVYGLAVDAQGQNVYVAVTLNSTIMRIDTTGGSSSTPTVLVSSLSGVRGLFFERTSSVLYAVGGSTMWRVNPTTGSVVATVALPGVLNAYAVTVDSSGNAYVADFTGGQVMLVAASATTATVFASQVPQQLGVTELNPYSLALTPDAACLVVLDGPVQDRRILVFGNEAQCGRMSPILQPSSSTVSSSSGGNASWTVSSSAGGNASGDPIATNDAAALFSSSHVSGAFVIAVAVAAMVLTVL